MDAPAYVLLLFAIVLGVAGQLLFKYAMSCRPDFRFTDVPLLVGDWSIFGGFVCYGMATLLYFKVLGGLEWQWNGP